MMDVHARRLFIASADHTQELPSISFVEPGVIGQKIQRIDPHRRHVIADILEKKARDPLVSEFFVHIDCAHIRRKILPLVEVVFDDPASGNDPASAHHDIPLRYAGFFPEAVPYALFIRFQRDMPSFMKPFGDLFLRFRPVANGNTGFVPQQLDLKYIAIKKDILPYLQTFFLYAEFAPTILPREPLAGAGERVTVFACDCNRKSSSYVYPLICPSPRPAASEDQRSSDLPVVGQVFLCQKAPAFRLPMPPEQHRGLFLSLYRTCPQTAGH